MHIICHAFPAWEGNYMKSTVELMKAVAAQGHRVLYVDYAYTWTDFFKSLFGKSPASWRRMLGLAPRLWTQSIPSREGACIHLLSLPPMLPANFLKQPHLHDAVNWLNSLVMGRHIRRAVRVLGLEAPTVLNAFNPGFGALLAGKLGESRLLYYCYDEIGAAAWAKRHGPRLEQAFIKKCDGVVVSSEGLQRKQAARHPAVFVVKNGVDAAHFGAAIPSARLPVIPNRRQDEKVVGYLGSIDDRLDFGLLEHLFQKMPEARFVFVGRVQNEAIRARLAAYSNVYLAGAHPPDALPAWVALMDVGLIPFVKNEFTAGIYPLKINEYLAAGKPVVATHFAPLDDFSAIAAIADTPVAFEQAVIAALAEVDAPTAARAAQHRRAFAGNNTWAARAQDLVRILDLPRNP